MKIIAVVVIALLFVSTVYPIGLEEFSCNVLKNGCFLEQAGDWYEKLIIYNMSGFLALKILCSSILPLWELV